MLSSAMVRPAWVAVMAVAACQTPDEFSGDPFPIEYVARAGAITVDVRVAGEPPRPAVLDLLSPLSVLDNGQDAVPSRRAIDLDLLGVSPLGGSVPRARFTGTVVQVHPCEGEPTCTVGDPAAPYPISAVLGADLLAGDAIRFDFAASQLYVLPDIAGTSTDRTRLCDGVFAKPFQGAGTLVLEGAEIAFTSYRPVVEVCLDPDVRTFAAPAKRGGDALFVISTGLGANIMTESAYLRYAESTSAVVPELLGLPVTTVRILSGPITGRLGSVPELALVATAPKDPRGPCREVYASSYLETADPDGVCDGSIDCPCEDNDRSCSAPAVVHITPALRGSVPFVIVPDTDPLLQSLRTELRPLVGEIDGILGTDVLAPIQLDVDYPHDRMLWRCVDPVECQVRPELDGLGKQPGFVACLADPSPVTRQDD
jgi:hypothetical protein